MVDSDALDLVGGGLPSASSSSQRDAESANFQRTDVLSLLLSRGDRIPPLDPVAVLVDSQRYFSMRKDNSFAGERASARPGDPVSRTLNETDGLSIFFNGMAAGEDMSTLIHILCQTLQRSGQTVPWPTSPLLDRIHTEKGEGADASKVRSLEGVQGKNNGTPVHSKSPFLHSSFPVSSVSTPSSLILRREWIKEASRAAALFSVENPAASDAVSLFYYSSCHTERLRLKGAIKGAGDREKGPDLFFFRPSYGVLRPLLSDRVAVALARQLLRDSHHSGNHGRLDEVERILRQIDPTPAVCAVLIDLYSRMGKWEGALRSLHSIPRSLWTEFDVAGVIRSFYHAALKNEVPSSSPTLLRELNSSPPGVCVEEGCENRSTALNEESRGEGTNDEFFTYPLFLMKQAMNCRISWSTPSAVNDALGLLSMKPSLWREACMLLDETVLSPHCVGEPRVCVENNDNTEEALVCTHVECLGRSTGEAELSLADATEDRGLARNAGLHHMRANAVTVYQACRALCQSPETAFSYAKALLYRFDIPIITDFRATEQYLSCCAHSGRWEEALRIMKEHRLHLVKERCRSTTVGQRGVGNASPVGCTASSRMRSGNDTFSNFNQECVHYRSNVYLELVKLFSESRCTEGVDALLQQKSLSKIYNPQTLSRAFNALIQTSKSVDEAMRYCDDFARSVRRRSRKRDLEKESLRGAASADSRHQRTQPEALCIPMKQGIFEALENESLHQLTLLNSMEGRWQEAVTIFQHLLHDPRRKLYVPTTEVHDCVQYALAQAPAPGASWQKSVALFFELCEERELPATPLAFQSTVKKCFSQGAGEVAQMLFKFMIRKGIRH